MKKFILFIFLLSFIFLFESTKAQDENHHVLSSGIGFINSFEHQVGTEGFLEYERRLANGWLGLYVQGRYSELDNEFYDDATYDFYTIRFDSAIGYRQYLTSNLSVFRPRVGVGAFFSVQDYEKEIASNTYLLTDDVGSGFEWEAAMYFAYDDFSWGFGYKGTIIKIEVISEDIKRYENHFFFTFSYSF